MRQQAYAAHRPTHWLHLTGPALLAALTLPLPSSPGLGGVVAASAEAGAGCPPTERGGGHDLARRGRAGGRTALCHLPPFTPAYTLTPRNPPPPFHPRPGGRAVAARAAAGGHRGDGGAAARAHDHPLQVVGHGPAARRRQGPRHRRGLARKAPPCRGLARRRPPRRTVRRLTQAGGSGGVLLRSESILDKGFLA